MIDHIILHRGTLDSPEYSVFPSTRAPTHLLNSMFPLTSEEPILPAEVSPPKLSRDLLGTFTNDATKNLRPNGKEREGVCCATSTAHS